MAKYVIPHSDEWFKGLNIYNPQQATMTRHIITLSGSVNVCSICGAVPTGDFHITNSPMSGKEYATLRLCNDCLTIRKNMYNEIFVQIEHDN